jgi:hypothetical protein
MTTAYPRYTVGLSKMPEGKSSWPMRTAVPAAMAAEGCNRARPIATASRRSAAQKGTVERSMPGPSW